MTGIKKKHVNMTLDIEVVDELDVLAESVGMNRSQVTNLLLRAAFTGDYVSMFQEIKETKKRSESNLNERRAIANA